MAHYEPVVQLSGTNATPRGKKQNRKEGAPIGMWHKYPPRRKSLIKVFSQFF